MLRMMSRRFKIFAIFSIALVVPANCHDIENIAPGQVDKFLKLNSPNGSEWKVDSCCLHGVWNMNPVTGWTDGTQDMSYTDVTKCTNWYGWTNDAPVCSISTSLVGKGLASLYFGNCWNTGVVKVLLDGAEIGSAGPQEPNELITFYYHGSSTLEIKEVDTAVIQFNKLETFRVDQEIEGTICHWICKAKSATFLSEFQ